MTETDLALIVRAGLVQARDSVVMRPHCRGAVVRTVDGVSST